MFPGSNTGRRGSTSASPPDPPSGPAGDTRDAEQAPRVSRTATIAGRARSIAAGESRAGCPSRAVVCLDRLCGSPGAHGSARPREGLRPVLPPLRRGGRDRPRGRRVSARPRRPPPPAESRRGRVSAPAQPSADHRPWTALARPPRGAGRRRGARAAVRLRRRLHRAHRPGPPGNPARRAHPARRPALRRSGGRRACAGAGGGAPRGRWLRRWRTPTSGSQLESYAVVFVRVAPGRHRAPPRCWSGPTSRASCSARPRCPSSRSPSAPDVTRWHFSYGVNDLVVVDWNAAFVYEPSGLGGHPRHPGDRQRPAARAPLLRRRARPEPGGGERDVEARATPPRLVLPQPLSRAGPAGPGDAAGDERVHRAGGELAEDHRRLLPGPGLRGRGGAAAHPGVEGDGHPEAGDPRQTSTAGSRARWTPRAR